MAQDVVMVANKALLFSVGVLLSFVLPQLPSLGLRWFLLVALVVLVVWASWQQQRQLRFFAIALLVVAIGMAYGMVRTERALARQWPVAEAGQRTTLVIRVASLPEDKGHRQRFMAVVVAPEPYVGKRLLLSDYQRRSWSVGSVWQIHTRPKTVLGHANQTGFFAEAWALSKGIDATGSVGRERQAWVDTPSWWQRLGQQVEQLRGKAQARVERVAGAREEGAALVSALALGRRDGFSDAHWQAFRRLGLSHLVSISGLHVGMVALVAAWLMHYGLWVYYWLVNQLSRPPRQQVPIFARGVMTVAGWLAALAYSILAGFGVPAQRSLVMISVVSYALLRQRYFLPWQVFFQALAWVLLFDPLAVMGVGFWLSFGMVAALILMFSGRSYRRRPKPMQAFLWTQYAITVTSVVVLLPFFGSLPLLSPVANFLAVPWFSLLLTPLVLLAIVLPFDALLSWVIALSQGSMDVMMAVAARAPMWSVPTLSYVGMVVGLLAVVALLLPAATGLRGWAALMLAAIVFYPSKPVPYGQVRVNMVDIGQGLAVHMTTANHQLLYDTGPSGAAFALLPVLRGAGVVAFDKVILSHNDHDHDGAWPEVKQEFRYGELLAGHPEAYPDDHAQYCAAGLKWWWDGVYFEMLTPPRVPAVFAQRQNKNNDSCILRVIANHEALLVMGDAGRDAENALVAEYGQALYSQHLVVGHHGSNTSTDAALLQAVAPQYALISAGFANAYGHPHQAVLRRLNAHQIKIWRSDLAGGAVLFLGSHQPWQSTLRFQPYWRKKPVKPSS